MWPRMIAGPTDPGVGEFRYQPALESGSVRDGTCTVPSLFSPRSSRADFTPSDGMLSEIGCDDCRISPLAASVKDGTTMGAAFVGFGMLPALPEVAGAAGCAAAAAGEAGAAAVESAVAVGGGPHAAAENRGAGGGA